MRPFPTLTERRRTPKVIAQSPKRKRNERRMLMRTVNRQNLTLREFLNQAYEKFGSSSDTTPCDVLQVFDSDETRFPQWVRDAIHANTSGTTRA